jgi:hypothetical protein
MTDELSISQTKIENRIFTVRDLQVMLDFHLAELFKVETKRLNEQVKRNKKRFPEGFMFQLSKQEWENLQSQIATANKENILQSQFATAKRRTIPYAFTEQGVAMLSAVLNSDTAISVSIQIINAFVKMRLLLSEHLLIDYRLEKVEHKQLETDQNWAENLLGLLGLSFITDFLNTVSKYLYGLVDIILYIIPADGDAQNIIKFYLKIMISFVYTMGMVILFTGKKVNE